MLFIFSKICNSSKDLLAVTMNGSVYRLINVFQNRFIVMEKLTAKTKVMKSDAVRISGLILLSHTPKNRIRIFQRTYFLSPLIFSSTWNCHLSASNPNRGNRTNFRDQLYSIGNSSSRNHMATQLGTCSKQMYNDKCPGWSFQQSLWRTYVSWCRRRRSRGLLLRSH